MLEKVKPVSYRESISDTVFTGDDEYLVDAYHYDMNKWDSLYHYNTDDMKYHLGVTNLIMVVSTNSKNVQYTSLL